MGGTRTSQMAEFNDAELGDIQGIILSAFGHLPYASYIFFQIVRCEGGGSWLERLVPSVTTATRWQLSPDGIKAKPAATLNVGLSYSGLEELGLPRVALD